MQPIGKLHFALELATGAETGSLLIIWRHTQQTPTMLRVSSRTRPISTLPRCRRAELVRAKTVGSKHAELLSSALFWSGCSCLWKSRLRVAYKPKRELPTGGGLYHVSWLEAAGAARPMDSSRCCPGVGVQGDPDVLGELPICPPEHSPGLLLMGVLPNAGLLQRPTAEGTMKHWGIVFLKNSPPYPSIFF